MTDKAWPEWAKKEDVDKYDNVACQICGKIQSPSFRTCIYCCKHDELGLTEEWNEGGGWELDAECARCGKNFDFSRQELIQVYKLVRK